MAGRRTLIFVAALAGLIALVAVASRGHSPTGGSTHVVDWRFLWEFVVIGLFAILVINLPLAVWAYWVTRISDPDRHANRQKRSLLRVSSFLILLLLISLALWLRPHRHKHGNATTIHTPSAGGGNPGSHAHTYPFDWAPAIIVLSMAAAAAVVVAYMLFRDPPPRKPSKAEIVQQLTSVLDDSLDDLRAERDPRRAVIATYARMERTLAGFGFPRAAAEAPREYLGRVLHDLLEASGEAVSRLTALFERAKFSAHEIDSGMKDEAIDALVQMRDDLRAAVPA